MVGRHWCYSVVFFSPRSPCRFSRDFISLRSSAYIVVMAQFFLVFLFTVLFRFFCFFFCRYFHSLGHKSCVNAVTTSFLPSSRLFLFLLLSSSFLFWFCHISWAAPIEEIPLRCVFFSRVGHRDCILQKSLNDNRSVQSQSHSRRFFPRTECFSCAFSPSHSLPFYFFSVPRRRRRRLVFIRCVVQKRQMNIIQNRPTAHFISFALL